MLVWLTCQFFIMRNTTLLFLFLLQCMVSFAQKHDYQWIMGYKSDFSNPYFGKFVIDFNFRPPRIDTIRTNMNFSGFQVSCCDSSGALLFYSNGVKIYNKNHQLMENGNQLNPGSLADWQLDKGYSLGYAGLVVPAPGKSNQYYMIHVGLEYTGSYKVNPLYYTTVDMNTNGGLGKVVAKNVVLDTGDFTTTVAVKHGNGRDWWIITAVANTGLQKVYLIDPSGIHPALVQDIGTVPAFPPESAGLCFVSPNGNYYTRGQAIDGIRIMDFNRCTGELGNLRFIPKNNNMAGWIYSPDSRFEFIQNTRFVGQIDIEELDAHAYLDTIVHTDYWPDHFPPFYTLTGWSMMGPDQKVYSNSIVTTANLNVTNSPNLPGGACDFQLHGLIVSRYIDAPCFNLPNYRLGAWENSPCDTIPLVMGNFGFETTRYDAARWQPETQKRQRTIPLFQDTQNKAGEPESRENDPLNPLTRLIQSMNAENAKENKEIDHDK